MACIVGSANSNGSLWSRTCRKRGVKNWLKPVRIMDHPKLPLGTVALLGLSTLTRARKKRGPRSGLDEPSGAMFESTWDRSTG